MNDYYVYEWIRLDTNEPFYVGKGKKNRWKELRKRNKWFNNIIKSTSVAVNILHDNLDEKTAFGLEVYYIWLYRDIIGYNLTNINDGGEGCALVGENNPWWKKELPQETKDKMSKNHADVSGENNPMYGVHRYGEDAPNYGKSLSKEWKDNISKSRIENGVAKGKNNPNAKSIICLTTKRIFYTAKEGAEYYNCNYSSIIQCCKGNYNSAGSLSNGTKLVWKYITIIKL